MCFLGQAVFTHGNSKFQIHQCVSTKHKHASSAGLHKLTVRSTRLLVTPDTSNTSNPSTDWQRADTISREILIFFLMWLSTEWDFGVSHELDPTKTSGDSFTLCHWDSIYTLVHFYDLNGYHYLKMKNTCIVTSQNSHTFALQHDITHLDNGKAREKSPLFNKHGLHVTRSSFLQLCYGNTTHSTHFLCHLHLGDKYRAELQKKFL